MESVHLAFGVAVEDGLVTPVVRNAESLDLTIFVGSEVPDWKSQEQKVDTRRNDRFDVYGDQFGNVWHRFLQWHHQPAQRGYFVRRSKPEQTCSRFQRQLASRGKNDLGVELRPPTGRRGRRRRLFEAARRDSGKARFPVGLVRILAD